jgi:hypothetical protein
MISYSVGSESRDGDGRGQPYATPRRNDTLTTPFRGRLNLPKGEDCLRSNLRDLVGRERRVVDY